MGYLDDVFRCLGKYISSLLGHENAKRNIPWSHSKSRIQMLSTIQLLPPAGFRCGASIQQLDEQARTSRTLLERTMYRHQVR